MASSFVLNAQAIVAREMSPIESVVVTIGKMEVGERFNVIAERAELEGTVRTFNPTTRAFAEEALKRYAESVAAMYRGRLNSPMSMLHNRCLMIQRVLNVFNV